MALLNSLFSGVSGLRNHQSMMDVIGNNISNVNTIGFKGSRVTFSDTFNQFVKAGTNPTEFSGGTNTYQIGLGSKINSIDRNWAQGTFERTGITTDLALQGPGMFVLKSNGENFFSRAGNFLFDADGRLVSPQNGAIVQGKVANEDGVVPPGNNLGDIVVDTSLKLPANSTSEIKWGGNLKSNSPLTRSEKITVRGNIQQGTTPAPIKTTIYNENGEEYQLEVTYTPTANPNEFTSTYEILDSDGNPLATPVTGTIGTVTFADPDGDNVWTASGATSATITDNNLNLNFSVDAASITQNASPTTISSSADGNRLPNIVAGSVTVFDSLGTSHQVTIEFTKIADNAWSYEASVPGTSTASSLPISQRGTINFNPDGTIVPANIPQLSFSPSGGANDVVIDLNFGSGFSGITQTSASSVVSALSQNGSASATLSNINIDQYGTVVGIFTNGSSRPLAQIMCATFANLNGLISTGDNLYSAYANSGEPTIGALGEETGTTLQSGALEQSNVDLSEEFTKMIVSQRGFQANARVITTADTLLQEITNLIR